MVVVVTMQSTVEPEVARRYAAAAGGQRESQLAVGQAVMELEAGLFGVALAIEMAGIGSLALALLRGGTGALNRRFLWFGLIVCALAAPTGIAGLIDGMDWLGRLEPLFSLVALVWLAATGLLLARASRSQAREARNRPPRSFAPGAHP